MALKRAEVCIPVTNSFKKRLKPAIAVILKRVWEGDSTGNFRYYDALRRDFTKEQLEKLLLSVLWMTSLQDEETKTMEDIFLHPLASSTSPTSSSTNSSSTASSSSHISGTFLGSRLKTRPNLSFKAFSGDLYVVYANGVAIQVSDGRNDTLQSAMVAGRIGFASNAYNRIRGYEYDVKHGIGPLGRCTNWVETRYGDRLVRLRAILVRAPKGWDPWVVMGVNRGWVPPNFKALLDIDREVPPTPLELFLIVMMLIAEPSTVLILKNNYHSQPHLYPTLGPMLNQSDAGELILRHRPREAVPKGGFIGVVNEIFKGIFDAPPTFPMTQRKGHKDFGIELPDIIIRSFNPPGTATLMNGKSTNRRPYEAGVIFQTGMLDRFKSILPKHGKRGKYAPPPFNPTFHLSALTFGSGSEAADPEDYEEIEATFDGGPRKSATRQMPSKTSWGRETSAAPFQSIIYWDLRTGQVTHSPSLANLKPMLGGDDMTRFDLLVQSSPAAQKFKHLAVDPAVPGVYMLAAIIDDAPDQQFAYGSFITAVSSKEGYTAWMLRTLRQFNVAQRMFRETAQTPEVPPFSLGKTEDDDDDEDGDGSDALEDNDLPTLQTPNVSGPSLPALGSHSVSNDTLPTDDPQELAVAAVAVSGRKRKGNGDETRKKGSKKARGAS